MKTTLKKFCQPMIKQSMVKPSMTTMIIMSAATLSLLAAIAGSAGAQAAGSGTLRGTLTDASGAAVAGATVVVRNIDTGIQRELTSTEAGVYVAPYLQSGHYEVQASSAGMATVVQKEILLQVGVVLTIDLTLPVNAAAETVTVTSESQ